jgi:hypothetical protein
MIRAALSPIRKSYPIVPVPWRWNEQIWNKQVAFDPNVVWNNR